LKGIKQCLFPSIGQFSMRRISGWIKTTLWLTLINNAFHFFTGWKCSFRDMLYRNMHMFGQSARKLFLRYLGLLLDENLSFLHHLQSVELMISRNLGIKMKLKNTLPQETPVLLYNTLIKTQLKFSAMIWELTFQSHLQKINSIHKRSLKLMGKN